MSSIYGVVGFPLEHSLSPVMHNAAIKHLGLEAEYKTFEIDPAEPEALANFCYESDLNQIAGFSVTMPYKQQIMDYMDHYDPLAKIVGSVNTVVNEDSMLIGHNTDAAGAMQALQEKTKVPGLRALVLGAGGAARAIAYSLNEFGADVFVFNRTFEKAEELAAEFKLEPIEHRQIAPMKFHIIVNATPVGSGALNESLLSADQIQSNSVVMDIVTQPLETKLLQTAKEKGAQIITGERMLLHQAVGQFELWFDQKAPMDVMEQALYKALESRGESR